MIEICHITPNHDLKPHISSEACSCKPSVQEGDGAVLVIHNAWDGREFYEEDEAQQGH